MPVRGKKWLMRSPFQGQPKREDLEIVEEELPPIKDGEFLMETLWWTVDPYMRLIPVPIGQHMIGSQVAKVVESKNPKFTVGDVVVNFEGWQTHSISDGTQKGGFDFGGVQKVDTYPSIPASTALGVLGMPGATALLGLMNILKPNVGETLVINAAAGAVGSILGQIAKIKGCRVVGFAGSDVKVEYLRSVGFDAAYNYKTTSSLEETLKEGCPKGIDMFFDMVGGAWFETVLAQMNLFGRVAICGFISEYNALEPPKVRPVTALILTKQVKVEGFNSLRWLDQWPDAIKEIAQWILEGKIKYNEVAYDGFDKMFEAFSSLFEGTNIGKVVVKA